ncbi:MAG: hypothetical protein R3344_04675, partial [Acidobacteriota bacterium]|nr:hypothetical protein [Acidobacteriota bacterium]
ETDFSEASQESFADTAVNVSFQITPRWNVAVGYRVVRDDLRLDEINNEHERDGGLLHVAYSF